MNSSIFADFASILSHLAPGLLDTALRSLVLACLVSLVVLSMRRASAATRHGIWLMGFVGLMLMPLLSAALPGWRVLPRVGSSSRDMSMVNPIGRASDQLVEMAPALSPQPAPQDSSLTTQTAAASSLAAVHESPPTLAVNALPVIQLQTTGVQPAPIPAARISLSWSFWVSLIWLAGAAMVLAHLSLAYFTLWLLQRRCVPIEGGAWHAQLNRIRQTLGIRREVELLSVPGRIMPMTWGIRRARLLLPDEAESWTAEQRDVVLLHELGHVRRFDCASQLLVQIACAFYWFNPFVWMARNRVQVERERACDDIVLNTGAAASTYARHLLQCAAAGPALPFVTAALAMARASTLESRLRTILDSTRNRRAISGFSLWMALGLMLAILVPVAALHAQESPASTSDAPTPGVAIPGAPATRPVMSGRRAGVGMASPFSTVGEALAAPKLGEGPTCALDATIYEVRIPVVKTGLLDVDALTAAAATPADFEKALAALGDMRPLYHTDQTVRLASDSIEIGTQTPFINNTRTDTNGRVINSVSYQRTGADFIIAGKLAAVDKVDLDLEIQLATISDSSAEIAPKVKASLFHTTTMSHKGEVAAKTPFVVLNADASSGGEDGTAVVYIARVKLGTPK